MGFCKNTSRFCLTAARGLISLDLWGSTYILVLPIMATLLRRPASIARATRNAADLFGASRSIYSNHTRPQLWSLVKTRQTRSYASVDPGDPKRPDNKNKNDKKNDESKPSDDNKKNNKNTENEPDEDFKPPPGSLLDRFSKYIDGLQEAKTLNKHEERFLLNIRDYWNERGEVPKEIQDFIKKHLDEKQPVSLAQWNEFMKVITKYETGRNFDEIKKSFFQGSQKPQDGKQQKSNGKDQNSNGGPKIHEFKFDPSNFIVASILSYFTYTMLFPGEASRDITWQEFRSNFFDKGLVEKLTVLNRNRVRVDLIRDAVAGEYPDSPASQRNFHYYFTIGSVDSFERKLEEAHKELGIPSSQRIPVAYVDEVPWFATALSFGPTLLLIGSVFYFSRRAGGGGGGQSGLFGIGKSRARRFNQETDVKIRFADVAGMDEAKLEIMEFVSFLKEPERFQKLGAKIPRGAILSGPPGTGKTLLAKATAGESGVPFFSVSGSEFVEMFVGVGPSRVRDLFANARKNTPCIIFIDEIDAIGKSRSKSQFGGGNDERESTLNQILTEMDGFNTSEQVVVLAGTNRPDVLDKALMRPGRFDRHIGIDRPTMKGRRQIFAVHLKKIVTKVDMEYLCGRLAALTPGFSGADIANCVNEAALVGKYIRNLSYIMISLANCCVQLLVEWLIA